MSSLSGGERQRVWLAMALAQQPQVLLLDEPTTFLDLNHQLEVLDLIRYLNREHRLTVVMVLHDLNQAARYAGRVVVLSHGTIYGDGTPQAIVTPQTLREVFGVEGHIMPGPDGVGLVIVPFPHQPPNAAGVTEALLHEAFSSSCSRNTFVKVGIRESPARTA
jgi:iron complex transport system ATP-binding protein